MVGEPVFVLVDGLDKLTPHSGSMAVFAQAVGAVSAAVCSRQSVAGAVSAILSGPISTVFGSSQQARVFLRPPSLPSPELVVPDVLWTGADARGLALLRNDMGGHGRALEVLRDVLSKPGGPPMAWQALADCVIHRLLETFGVWLNSADVAPVRELLLEAIISRRPFSSIADVVAGSWTVDTVCSLGLVQWRGGVEDPQPPSAPFVLLLLLRQKLLS